MNPEQEFVPKTSEQSEVFDVQAAEDIRWLNELVKKGIPVEISNAYDAAISLSQYVYDEFIPEENEAKVHIEKAIELFRSSYEQSIAFTVGEANRIIAAYQGIIHYQRVPLISVSARWTPMGEAFLEFQTDPNQADD
jgi:hypothetical protein